MTELKSYRVYTRNRGTFLIRAYSRRHAIAVVVARLGLAEIQTLEVITWCVAEVKEKKENTES